MKAQYLKIKTLFSAFVIPLIVLGGILGYLFFRYILNLETIAISIIYAAVLLGTYEMIWETLQSLFKKQFALDYIAIIAIVVALITQQYAVAGILAFMICTGTTLEDYGSAQAKRSLTQLIDRIPNEVLLWINNAPDKKVKINTVKIGTEIFIRKGEVVPLDGTLLSETGETDESSLTGEPYFITKRKGDLIRSGTINIGQAMVIKVTKEEGDSTYKKIITMVKEAQEEKSPMVRLADQYASYFTIITFTIASFAFWYSGYQLEAVLAVLAVATPCPLIIATPIALLGGVNASAKRKIIIKKLSALEALSRIDTIVFDKTGTITLGKPVVSQFTTKEKKPTSSHKRTLLAIAAGIERNSLHPLAKAIVSYAKEQQADPMGVTDVHEIIGKGIQGTVDGKKYILSKLDEQIGMGIVLKEGKEVLAEFRFEDEIKTQSIQTIKTLHDLGLTLHIFTGDKKEAAEKVVKQLGEHVILKADCSPEDKQQGITSLKKSGKTTAMVGDGINDAPALALADVGLAFSNQEEQTAASEAADIVFLGGDFSMVTTSWSIAKRTITIAKQSIQWGIGLSILAMLFAAFGIIPPIVGAGLQEAIDVAVIINALRASK